MTVEIVPGIHQVKVPLGIPDNPLGFTNTYLIRANEGWMLIDTGWNSPGAFEAFERELHQIGVGMEDIRLMIITHVHPDHYGLTGRIKQLSGAQIAVHLEEKAFLDSRYLMADAQLDRVTMWLHHHGVPEGDLEDLQNASTGVLGDLAIPPAPDQLLTGGETISCGKFDLEVISTPGHSSGHICLYERSEKLLFSGDHILPVTTPNIAVHLQSKVNPLGDYLESLKAMRQLDVRLTLPAHEEIFDDLVGRIDELLEHHDDRMAAVLGTIADEAKTAYQIASEVPWSIFWEDMGGLDKRIALCEALAHLEALRFEGRVSTFDENDRAFYQLEAGHKSA